MKYEVIPFIMINYKDYSIVQNYKVICKINNSELITFFNYLDKNNVSSFSYEDLNNFFTSDVDGVTKFMCENNLIFEKKEIKAVFNNVIVSSNDETFINSFKYNSQGVNCKIDISHMENYNINAILNKANISDSLLILFLNPFNYQKYKNIVKVIKEKNILCRISFFYNNKIYIANYYKKDWYNPCPICFFAHLEGTIRARSKMQFVTSYQDIIDLIYNDYPEFEIQNKFNNSDIMLLTNNLITDLKNSNHIRENEVAEIDYINNTIEYDVPTYWEMCECYE